MVLSLRSGFRKVWLTLSSVKTGVILIILVVIFSAAGTVILQRPITDPDDIQRAYSPAMLRFLDAVGESLRALHPERDAPRIQLVLNSRQQLQSAPVRRSGVHQQRQRHALYLHSLQPIRAGWLSRRW